MPDDLTARIAATTGLPPREAERVIADVVAYYHETAEQFVRRRHSELQHRGWKNPQIFATIAAELGDRLVAAPEVSERQLRRIIYGG